MKKPENYSLTKNQRLFAPQKSFKRLVLLIFLSGNLSGNALFSQTTEFVQINDNGVMTRGADGPELKGFGVNYTVPFAHAYRQAENMGINQKEAIDQDLYHLSRLGFDLYRCHIWDTEISDTLGNLLNNEHLDAFDYLVKRLKDHDFNYVLTPIAYWGNGWPEPDEDTPGFSAKYGKGNSLSNEAAIKAGQNYLQQFLNHVNPYTGLAYKDDPNVLAFEVSNEPHHRGKAAEVTRFVKGMVDAMKATGVKTPIFYNMSHGVHFTEAYFDGGAEGGTFQWYPTGLGYGKEIPGNVLPNVNDYDIPFDDEIKGRSGAKLVYEFDAANIGRSYVYAAMARSFRTAGIQLGTHFSYDPTYLGEFNTEYNTHYMNLNYTPQKALALMISGEIFHQVPMYKEYGTYPENQNFDDFSVSYLQDLALLNGAEKYYYSNSTDTAPKNERQLKRIAGYGDSPIAEYSGKGAYFLDKLADGIWRLEVQPDAIWVQNPFGRNSPDKTVGVINWRTQQMTLKLAELGGSFEVKAINKDNGFTTSVNNGAFDVYPGTYLVSAKGKSAQLSPFAPFGTNKLGDFFAPKSNVTKAWFLHEPLKELSTGRDLEIKIQYIAPEAPKEIVALVQSSNGFERLVMERTASYEYSATLSADNIGVGYLTYDFIVSNEDGKSFTFPTKKEGVPFAWDFFDRERYEVRVVDNKQPVYLFDAKEDYDDLVIRWSRGNRLQPTSQYNEAEYLINVQQLFVPDNENLNAEPIYDYSFKHFIIDKVEGRKPDLSAMKKLVIKGRALNDKKCKLQVAFVTDDGAAYGTVINIAPKMGEYEIDLSKLKMVRTVTLPRPYPSFLPYYLEHNIQSAFDLSKAEAIQFSIGPGLSSKEVNDPHGIGLVKVYLK